MPPIGREPCTFCIGVRCLTYHSMGTCLSIGDKYCNYQEHMQCNTDYLFFLHEFPSLLTGIFFFAYRNSLFCIQEFSFLLTGISRIFLYICYCFAIFAILPCSKDSLFRLQGFPFLFIEFCIKFPFIL